MSHCQITLSVNAGVALHLGAMRVWSDALHDHRVVGFSTVTPERWNILQAHPDFASPDLLFFTHCHPDHYSRALTEQVIAQNPQVALVLPEQEFDRQLDELGWSPGDAATRLGMYMEVGMYNLEKSIRDAFRSLLELLFAAASLLIDTVRTFFLVVLSVLGPIAFSISVWDGLQSTLGQWFTRYISVYLWLPVSDLFSCMLAKIQVLMLQNDIAELQGNPDYSLDNSNCVYIIFMLIGIVGYFTVPTVSGWIVQAGGGGNYSRNLNRTATKAGGFTAGAGGAALGNIGGRIRGK